MLDLENKRNTEPYDIPGRWYKFFIESTGSTIKLTQCDLDDSTISGTTLKFPDGFRAIDYKIDIHTITESTVTYNAAYKFMTGGIQACSLPPASSFDYMTAYIYGYMAE